MKRRLVCVILVGSLIFFTVSLFSTEPETIPQTVWRKVAGGLNFPEGPAWDGENTLYFANCNGGWIGQTTGTRTDTFLVSSPDTTGILKTNGLTFFEGALFACDFGRKQILKITPDRMLEIYATGYENQNFSRPNDLAFDKSRNLYFTDPAGYDCMNPDGRIYRISANAKDVSIARDSLAFPNGLAFSPNGQSLYVAESACEQVDIFKVFPDGSLADKQVFVHLPGGDPDGLALDINGNLYVAHFGGGAVYVVNPQGEIIRKILTPGKKPSNLEFGGYNLKTLYLTETETNALYSMPVNIPGQLLSK